MTATTSELQGASTPRVAPLPRWWAPHHATSWERVKEAMRRDWEQTKAHFSMSKGRDLNQGVGDTLKQAAGVEALPAITEANVEPPPVVEEDWATAEGAIRYGFGARLHFAKHQWWNDQVEELLRREWEGDWGLSWERARNNVHRGWDAAEVKP